MRASNVLLSTTSTLEGWRIDDYLGPVSAQLVIGTGFFTDFFSGWTDLFGAHSRSYQQKLDRINGEALDILSEKAQRLRANVVLGLRVDHDEISGSGKSMLMVTASGTAARAQKIVTKPASSPAEPRGGRLSGDELREASNRQRTIHLASEKKLQWDSESTWRFIVEHGVWEIADEVVATMGRRLPDKPMVDGGVDAATLKLREYMLSIDRGAAAKALYKALGDEPAALRSAASALIHEMDLFDPTLVREALQGDQPNRRIGVLAVLSADQAAYSAHDADVLEGLAALVAYSFPPLPTHAKKGMLGTKEIWVCLCNNENGADTQVCYCGRDRSGVPSNLPKPEEAAERLRAKATLIRQLLNGGLDGLQIPATD